MLFGMSAGTAVAVINYISQIFTPVESLGMEIQTIQSAIAGIHRINEFFALEERTENPAWQMKQVDTDRTPLPFVEFKDVTFGYDEHTVLQHPELFCHGRGTGDARRAYRGRKEYDTEAAARSL